MHHELTLNLEDLSVESFVPDDSGLTETAAASRLYNTVYFYYETEQRSCGGSCGCHIA